MVLVEVSEGGMAVALGGGEGGAEHEAIVKVGEKWYIREEVSVGETKVN